MTYQLPLEITREENLWMARSSAIQGFLATGETFDQLFGELPAIAQAMFEIWWRPETENRTVIPNHAAREIPIGTLQAILKDLSFTLQDLNPA